MNNNPLVMRQFCRAARYGNAERMRELIPLCDVDYKKLPDGSKNTWCNTPLILAVNGNHVECVRLLIEAKCDVNLVRLGATALISAVKASSTACVEELIRAGCDLDFRHRDGTALEIAIEKGSYDCCRVLVEAGADVNTMDGGGITPLMNLAYKGHSDLCQLLITRGCEFDAVDRNNNTALICAAAQGHLPCLKLLVQAGCNLEVKGKGAQGTDRHGLTALGFAMNRKHEECALALIEANCSLNVRVRGWHPVKFAARNGLKRCLSAFLDAGVEMKVVERSLWDVARTNQIECLQLLVESGVSLECTDLQNAKHSETVRILMEAGCDFHPFFNGLHHFVLFDIIVEQKLSRTQVHETLSQHWLEFPETIEVIICSFAFHPAAMYDF